MARRLKLLVIAICLLGALVRVWNVYQQVPEDDEMHAVFAATSFDAAYIFTHHSGADYTIPLALLMRFAVTHGGVSEIWLRTPEVIAGLLFLALFPLWLWHRRSPEAALAGAALAASSPLLVRYSRYARPYELVVLFSFVALVGAFEVRRGGDRRWGIACAIAGALAIWLNPICAPSIALAWILAAKRRWVPLAGAALVLLLLGPSLPSLLQIAEQKIAGSHPTAAAWYATLRLVLGPRELVITSWSVGLAVAGALVEEWPVIAAALVQPIAVELLQPFGGLEDHVLARYSIAALPWLLVLVAQGLVRFSRWTLPVLAAGFIALVIWRGPLLPIFARPNAFTNHNELWRRQWDADPSRLSPCYRDVGRGRVFEGPWTLQWRHTYYFAAQAEHRRPVSTVWLDMPGWAFRHLLPMSQVSLGAEDRLIVHRDVVGEAQYLNHRAEAEDEPRFRQQLVHQADGLIYLALKRRDLRQLCADNQIVVFGR